ncbi:MAG: CDP-alcohol phosphatidyltransferase family protein [Desulfofustis sp.]|jgi:phosphatidylglycerophosphate synthase
MLDRYSLELIRPWLRRLARLLGRYGVRADQVTIVSFLIGLLGVASVASQHYRLGLLLIVLSRIGDGIDGSLARISGSTDRGAFLDISLDFIFYSAVVFGFGLADPAVNSLAAAFLIFSFVTTGVTFLAYAIMAERRGISDTRLPGKGFYYLGGLAEGTETIAFFVLACLLPSSFPLLAWIFGTLCIISATARIIYGYTTLD